MKSIIPELLKSLGMSPILIDIGASGEPINIWKLIAPQSVYVGFEPDRREVRQELGGGYLKSIIIPAAVTSAKEGENGLIYLTKSPYCSSMLQPDMAAITNYLFSDLFEVERQSKVPVTTINATLSENGLQRVDWFKTDSQGMDLRLFKSLDERLRNRVLAVDVEPGLIDAYVGEDLFVEAHQYLVCNGFWLSDLQVKGSVRLRRKTLDTITPEYPQVNKKMLEKCVRTSPGWCEARYLKTIESMREMDATLEDTLLLGVFAVMDEQFGYALDIVAECERKFGISEQIISLKNVAISAIMARSGVAVHQNVVKRLLPWRVQQWLKSKLA